MVPKKAEGMMRRGAGGVEFRRWAHIFGAFVLSWVRGRRFGLEVSFRIQYLWVALVFPPRPAVVIKEVVIGLLI